VQLVSRRPSLKFHGAPQVGSRVRCGGKFSVRNPGSGPGWRLRFLADAPMAFHYLPRALRLEAVRRVLGPSGAWFVKEKLIGRVPLHLGCTPQRGEIQGGRIRLHIRAEDGSERENSDRARHRRDRLQVALDRLKFISRTFARNSRWSTARQSCRPVSNRRYLALFRWNYRRKQLRSGDAICFWSRLCCSDSDSIDGEVESKRSRCRRRHRFRFQTLVNFTNPALGTARNCRGCLAGIDPLTRKRKSMKRETIAIHAGYDGDPATKAVAVPIYQTVAFEFDSAEHGAALFNLEVEGRLYTRIGKPDQCCLEKRVARSKAAWMA